MKPTLNCALALLLLLSLTACNLPPNRGTPNLDPKLAALSKPLLGIWQGETSQLYADTTDHATAAYLDISRKYHALENEDLDRYFFVFQDKGMGYTMQLTPLGGNATDTLYEYFNYRLDTANWIVVQFVDVDRTYRIPPQDLSAKQLVLLQNSKIDLNDPNIDVVIPKRFAATAYARLTMKRFAQ